MIDLTFIYECVFHLWYRMPRHAIHPRDTLARATAAAAASDAPL